MKIYCKYDLLNEITRNGTIDGISVDKEPATELVNVLFSILMKNALTENQAVEFIFSLFHIIDHYNYYSEHFPEFLDPPNTSNGIRDNWLSLCKDEESKIEDIFELIIKQGERREADYILSRIIPTYTNHKKLSQAILDSKRIFSKPTNRNDIHLFRCIERLNSLLDPLNIEKEDTVYNDYLFRSTSSKGPSKALKNRLIILLLKTVDFRQRNYKNNKAEEKSKNPYRKVAGKTVERYLKKLLAPINEKGFQVKYRSDGVISELRLGAD